MHHGAPESPAWQVEPELLVGSAVMMEGGDTKGSTITLPLHQKWHCRRMGLKKGLPLLWDSLEDSAFELITRTSSLIPSSAFSHKFTSGILGETEVEMEWEKIRDINKKYSQYLDGMNSVASCNAIIAQMGLLCKPP